MKAEKYVVVLFFIGVFIFAFWREEKEQKNCYTQGIHSDFDTEKTACKKIIYCLQASQKTIKWRRSIMSAIITTFLLYSIVYRKFPEGNELFLTVLIVYFVFYISWSNLNQTVDSRIEKIGISNVRYLRSRLK